jgi:hypothetical protein
VVLAGRGDSQLAALYLTRPPPGLEAQTFPLPLPPLPGLQWRCHAHHGFFACRVLCQGVPGETVLAGPDPVSRGCMHHAGVDGEGGARAAVEALAWDGPGERLALAYRAKGTKGARSAGAASPLRVAVFATQQKPILSLRLLGLAAEPSSAPAGKALPRLPWLGICCHGPYLQDSAITPHDWRVLPWLNLIDRCLSRKQAVSRDACGCRGRWRAGRGC